MYKLSETTEKIIGAAHKVHNTLGFGFLEKVYHNALIIEMRKAGLSVESEKAIQIKYDEEVIGDYVADIIVNNSVIVEVKSVQTMCPAHEAQLVNYLKATNIDVGLLLNFGKSLEVKRKIFETARMT